MITIVEPAYIGADHVEIFTTALTATANDKIDDK